MVLVMPLLPEKTGKTGMLPMLPILTCRALARPALAIALLAISSPAAAQDEDAPGPDHLAALKSCQAMTDDASRLQCFDRAVRTVLAATEAGDLRLIDREAMRDTRRRLFGFSLPRIGLFGGGQGDEEMEVLESTITSVRFQRSDAFTFKIAEGDATWQVTNAPARLRRPEVGDKVEFKKASMGSYFIRIDGQIGVKGQRIQ